jgi:uncharacterized C2H2 Zn-finger protein
MVFQRVSSPGRSPRPEALRADRRRRRPAARLYTTPAGRTAGASFAAAPCETWIAGGTPRYAVPYVEYDENEAVCPQCGSAFRSPEVLEAHVRETHGGPAPPAPGAPGKSVRCSVCGARFASVSGLGRHNRESHVG